MRKFTSILFVSSIVLFTGCAKDQLLLKTYSPPKKPSEVKKMVDNSESDKGFINIEVLNSSDPYYCKEVSDKRNCRVIAKGLNTNVKKFISQTSFISLNETQDDATVGLNMKLIQLNYKSSNSDINMFAKVEFTVEDNEKGVLYKETYEHSDDRHSRAGKQGLPSKSQMLSEASEVLAKRFIKDISPLKTRKLVELKSLPSKLEYTIRYVKGKSYKKAIEAMEKYKGEKDANYHFNLAVYYECYGAKIDDMAQLAKADENYEKALSLDSEDEVIVKGKIKFDKFYSIVKEVLEQKKANSKRSNDFEMVN